MSCSALHVSNTKIVVLFVCPFVNLYFDLRVFFRSVWVVDKAVRQGVVQDNRKWLVTLLELVHSRQKLLELCVGSTITLAEWVVLLKMIDNFVEHTFHSRVDCPQRAWLQLQIDFWDLNVARVAFENDPIDVLRLHDVKCDLRGAF